MAATLTSPVVIKSPSASSVSLVAAPTVTLPTSNFNSSDSEASFPTVHLITEAS